MNPRNCVIGLLGLIVLVGGCPPTQTPTDITACDPQGCISEQKFLTNISNKLQNNVVGYVVTVGALPPIFSGQARTSEDKPSLAMLPSDLTIVASVSKPLTAIGVLQSLASHNLTIDDKIWPYIYSDWKIEGKNKNIDTITFRDLLTHSSGFREDCNDNETGYDKIKAQIIAGVELTDKTPSYNNCNFVIFRDLLPVMEGIPNNLLADSQNERGVADANFYISYMNQHVFSPVGIQTRGCMLTTPPIDPTFLMLSYPFPAGSTHGWNVGGDWTLTCSAGGWALSAGDLFLVLNDLANGNVLLTKTQKTDKNTGMNPNCLGWDCSVRSDCPNPYVCKNGDHATGNIAIWTYVGIFKCTVPVVVIVNSFLPSPYQSYDGSGAGLPNSGDIIGLVKDAYNGAAVAGAPQPCP